ncbi:terpenoid synthase [Auricularia subglabra TFB-10046 SS5]|uniref:Terpenoid synthase n=1 Tax=Auricularia subglabra (strain TFB-10046 / SS5) TaxID=717982 RepID=J0DAC5_AURST|nr:terpenoid synthase [Auricularia subglabra TFB-10046 SS5]
MEGEDWTDRVQVATKRCLRALDMHTPTEKLDPGFYRLCHDTALAKGYVAEGWPAIEPYLEANASIAQISYAHLHNTETKVWVALHTAFGCAIEDTYTTVPEDAVSGFVRRMLGGERQPYANLEKVAQHIREVSQHADELRAGLVTTSIFNGKIDLQVDRLMLERGVPRAAERFVEWCGLMSGQCEAFGMFVFPPDVPFHAFAPALPDMMIVMRNVNDVLSFYKEEKAGDAANQISLLAETRQISKLDALDMVTDDALEAHERSCNTLTADAQKAWIAFMRGYVAFHWASERYRLKEMKQIEA